MDERILTTFDMELRAFMAEKLRIKMLPNSCQLLGFADAEGVMCGWMFERYTGPGGSVFSHWAARGPRSVKRYMLNIAAMYIFDQLKCEIVYGEVPAKDTHTRAVDQKLGFVEVARLQGCFPDDDLLIFEMKKAQCRWLDADFKEATDG